MELLDRQLQRTMLQQVANAYPGICQPTDIGYTADSAVWNVNMCYLAEHELVSVQTTQAISDRGPSVILAKATARGLDFLQDDGGLGAILNVVTVRFEAETLRALIDARIDASDAPPAQKSAIKSKLADLSTEALKELTKKLVGKGLENWPTALDLLQRAADQLT